MKALVLLKLVKEINPVYPTKYVHFVCIEKIKAVESSHCAVILFEIGIICADAVIKFLTFSLDIINTFHEQIHTVSSIREKYYICVCM